jgi:hypothetical protein
VRDVTGKNWGLLIAFILPGSVTLLSLAVASPTIHAWLVKASAQSAGVTVGGFLCLTLASVMAGLTTSTIRWAVIDGLHHATGIPRPVWDESKLQEKLGAFGSIVEDHYRYYQFYANTLVALTLLGVARIVHASGSTGSMNFLDIGIAFLAVLYWAGSRDTLRRYYSRASIVMGRRNESEVRNDERKRSAYRRSKRDSESKAGRHEHQPSSRQGAHSEARFRRRYPSEEGPQLQIEAAGRIIVIRLHW